MKNVIYLCLGLTAVLLLCLFLPKTSNTNAEETSIQITVNDKYTVREFEGQIGIFTNDEAKPIEVFETSVSLLPQSDRELLKNGITVDTPEELQKLIEDFTG